MIYDEGFKKIIISSLFLLFGIKITIKFEKQILLESSTEISLVAKMNNKILFKNIIEYWQTIQKKYFVFHYISLFAILAVLKLQRANRDLRVGIKNLMSDYNSAIINWKSIRFRITFLYPNRVRN